MFGTLKSMFEKKYNDLSADEVNNMLSDKNTVIVDVREPYEFSSGHIPKAKNIPLSQVSQRLPEINKDKHIVVVCASGARSARAASLLSNEGYDVSNMVGGMFNWKGKVN